MNAAFQIPHGSPLLSYPHLGVPFVLPCGGDRDRRMGASGSFEIERDANAMLKRSLSSWGYVSP